MENSKISWTDHTFNPWIGCTKVSDGCTNCYAETLMDKRYGRVSWGKGNPRHRTSPGNWKQPLKWDRQAEKEGVRLRVFCASLADIFDSEVPDSWRDDLFDLIWQTPNLDWLLLTKRPDQVKRYTSDEYRPGWWTHASNNRRSLADWPNVWLGVSVEDQETADDRVSILLQTPAALHFISYEPALGPIDFPCVPYRVGDDSDMLGAILKNHVTGYGIDWIIVGGESGAKARPMHPEWPRSIRDQCQDAGVAFHFKQWGEWAPREVHGERPLKRTRGDMVRVGKKNAGRELDGRTWDEIPEVCVTKDQKR